MRFTIIVLISYIINTTLVFGENNKVADNSINGDSISQLLLLRYEYEYFLAQNDEEKYASLWPKIEMCLKMNNFNKATQEMERIILLDKEVLYKNSFFIRIEQLLFEYELYNTCLEMMQNDTSSNQTKAQSFIKVLCLNQEGQLAPIKNEIRTAAIGMKKDTTIIFNDLKNYDISSVSKKSVLLQSLLPGAGMINEGELQEGLTSFLLNGMFVAAPIVLSYHRLYVTAFSYGLIPLSKFYLGGIKHTKYLANKNYKEKLVKLKQQNAMLLFQFYNQ
jgi:hypothetical protein